ncbi:hypothetical protein FHR32_001778 [Streptosporangium album]|uniref:Uncharacterized protein n=1 Tax=Streptosporangium album TaxID=47479 RepID=A0A7W7RSM7_9ACTN|nr:hypothetical protein [Streptosporangium album]MBB4937473.1 hypothetical protein [Streptosporangium album]
MRRLHRVRRTLNYVNLSTPLGLPMLPLYVVAVVVSILICGHQASWNVFERLADLEDGNYPYKSPWWHRKDTTGSAE